ncbi:MAG: amino acid permease [bacterium]
MRYKIGLLDSIFIVVGSMIGSGIFLVPSIVATKIPDGMTVTLIWIIAGIITTLGAINYAELASMFPQQGGQYAYLRETYGKSIGFLFVWTSFFVIQAGTIAAVAIATAKYLGTFLPLISEQNILLDLKIIKINTAQIVAILSIIILTYINILGLKAGTIVQNIFTISKVLVILVLLIAGFAYEKGSFVNLTSSKVEFDNINLMLMVFAWSLSKVFFAYDAWYYLTYISHEIRNPHKTIPLAMVIGTAITTLIYVLTTACYFYVLGVSQVANSPDNKVAEQTAKILFPLFGVYFISMGIIISTVGCNNGLILTSSRLIYALAVDRLFFSIFSREHPIYQTPHTALIFQAIWISILILLGNYSSLLTYVTFASIGFNFLTVLAVMVLRIRNPNQERPFKTWLYPFTTLAYLISTFLFLFYTLISNPIETLIGVGIMLSGLVAYKMFSYSPKS